MARHSVQPRRCRSWWIFGRVRGGSHSAMSLVLISPERDDLRELAVLDSLFAAGLERYHVRKPHASAAQLEAWLRQMPASWRPKLILHQHHELVDVLGLGGRHWRDQAPTGPDPQTHARGGLTSRSCHDIARLRAALGSYDSVFFGPIFPSISKPGYTPTQSDIGEAVGAVLHTRTAAERRTTVIAIGGMTADTVPRALALGFDGIAVLGAVWQAPDPVTAFIEIQRSVAAATSSALAAVR
jgi:thiamine-phosphate pyrophosphorylase